MGGPGIPRSAELLVSVVMPASFATNLTLEYLRLGWLNIMSVAASGRLPRRLARDGRADASRTTRRETPGR